MSDQRINSTYQTKAKMWRFEKVGITDYWRQRRIIDALKLKGVNRYTKAPVDGREIVCPKCSEKVRVYHFSWSAIGCTHCKTDIDKDLWTVALTEKQKYSWVWRYDWAWDKKKEIRSKRHYRQREVNHSLLDDINCYIDTSDWPDLCDSYIESASWVDGSELTDEELEFVNEDSGFVYDCCYDQLH